MFETTTFDIGTSVNDDEILRNQILYIASKRKQLAINNHLDQVYSTTFKQWEQDVNKYIEQLEIANSLLNAAQYKYRTEIIQQNLNDAIASISMCAKQFDQLCSVINELATRSNIYTESSATLENLKDRLDNIIESSNCLLELKDIKMAESVRTYQMKCRSINQKIAIAVDKLRSLTTYTLKTHANGFGAQSESDYDCTSTSEDDEVIC